MRGGDGYKEWRKADDGSHEQMGGAAAKGFGGRVMGSAGRCLVSMGVGFKGDHNWRLCSSSYHGLAES